MSSSPCFSGGKMASLLVSHKVKLPEHSTWIIRDTRDRKTMTSNWKLSKKGCSAESACPTQIVPPNRLSSDWKCDYTRRCSLRLQHSASSWYVFQIFLFRFLLLSFSSLVLVFFWIWSIMFCFLYLFLLCMIVCLVHLRTKQYQL